MFSYLLPHIPFPSIISLSSQSSSPFPIPLPDSFYTCRCLLFDTYISSMFIFWSIIPIFSSLPSLPPLFLSPIYLYLKEYTSSSFNHLPNILITLSLLFYLLPFPPALLSQYFPFCSSSQYPKLPKVWPRMFYRSGWLRCVGFISIGLCFVLVNYVFMFG
jgi:hypothetical protein